MTRTILALAPALALLLGACDSKTAVFVTSSTVGINVDSKPPTVGVAYERYEGFVGPRFNNGGAPPVVASMETGGTVFDPQIRQTYATGNAAVAAASGKEPTEKTDGLQGDTRLMFFGTGTTLGFRVGFDPNGVPDSLVLGYKRKEASVIPLGAGTNGKAVYPSVLASIDNTSTMTVLGRTGLATKQFFATGQAAEALATNKTIQAAFQEKAAASLLDSLTQDQLKNAKATADADRATANDRVSKILAGISTAGKLDPDKLAALVDTARANGATGIPVELKKEQTLEGVKSRINNAPSTIDALFKALPASAQT